uniref:Uncharacterized protein n=1 Tax=Sipha flava TaxID=143950 RepID=A0A2S2QHH4_9HEMI
MCHDHTTADIPVPFIYTVKIGVNFFRIHFHRLRRNLGQEMFRRDLSGNRFFFEWIFLFGPWWIWSVPIPDYHAVFFFSNITVFFKLFGMRLVVQRKIIVILVVIVVATPYCVHGETSKCAFRYF